MIPAMWWEILAPPRTVMNSTHPECRRTSCTPAPRASILPQSEPLRSQPCPSTKPNELQATCSEESQADPAFPLPVGIGIDEGEAIPVEDGYRGVALNMAARLCSNAAAGQVLVTRSVAGSGGLDREISFEDRGPASFK